MEWLKTIGMVLLAGIAWGAFVYFAISPFVTDEISSLISSLGGMLVGCGAMLFSMNRWL